MANKLRIFQNTLALSAVTLIIVVWSTVSFLAYQNSLLKRNAGMYKPQQKITSPQTSENIEDRKTYRNEKYGFQVDYYPESPPTEKIGSEESGQFSHLLLIDFGQVPLKSKGGFILEVNGGESEESYRADIVGHIADSIDSEVSIKLNSILWKKLNYRTFITSEHVPVTLAFTNGDNYGYAIIAPSSIIDQILSTFRFTE